MRQSSIICAVLCAIAMARLAWAAEPVLTLPPSDPMPVVVYCGPPAEECNVARFREMVEAGFTLSFTRFPDATAMTKALDAAAEAGMKLFLSTPELDREPEATVRRFKDHPGLGGYFIVDEPNAKQFPRLAEQVRRIQSVDAHHPCYVNLFPNYASSNQLGCETYADYVAQSVEQIPTPMISFDHYPVTKDGLRPGWYENLEVIAAAAKQSQRPFWAFAMTVRHDAYPSPTLEQLRLEVFSNLAYGAQAIEYFTYWTYTSKQYDFQDAPIARNGQRTFMYDRVKQMNAEIRALAPVFVGATVETLGHTGSKLPRGTRPYVPAGPVIKLQTVGTGTVVSQLANGARRYLVVVNRDDKKPTTVNIELDATTPISRVTKQAKVQPISSRQQTVELPPGDILILTWSAPS